MKHSTLANHKADTPSMAISPDGSLLVTGTAEGRVFLHRLPKGTILRSLEQQPAFVNKIAFSPDGRRLAVCSTHVASPEGTTCVWQMQSWELWARLGNNQTGGGESLAFTPDNACLVVGHADGSARIWRLSDRTIAHTFQDSSMIPVPAIDNPNALLAVGNHRAVKLWGLRDLGLVGTLPLEGLASVKDMAFSSNGAYLAAAAYWGPIHLWKTKIGTLAGRLLEEHPTCAIDFAPDGLVLACGCEDGRIRVVSIPAGRLQRTISAHDGWVRDLEFTPDGRALISSGYDGAVRLWQGLRE